VQEDQTTYLAADMCTHPHAEFVFRLMMSVMITLVTDRVCGGRLDVRI
jgi:hypothetical protein